MASSFFQQRVPLKPRARQAMEFVETLGMHLAYTGTQGLCQEVVVAIPLTLTIQGREKEIPPLKIGQHASSILLAGQRITKIGGKTIRYRGCQQEAPDILRLPLQHLVHQVARQKTMIAAQ